MAARIIRRLGKPRRMYRNPRTGGHTVNAIYIPRDIADAMMAHGINGFNVLLTDEGIFLEPTTIDVGDEDSSELPAFLKGEK